MVPAGRNPDCATMCYMSETEKRRRASASGSCAQNLSVYLDRVKAGETLEVTEHGRPVARLGPNQLATPSILDQMIADGRAAPAMFDHRQIPPAPRIPGSKPLSQVILEMRDEEER